MGSVLNFLALLCLPAKIRVVVQPEVMETELWSVGPIFALMIGVWSLPTLLLGVIDSSASRKTVFSSVAAILTLANVFLVILMGDQMRFWRGLELQMLFSYSPFIAPCIVVDVFGAIYLFLREKLVATVKDMRIRVLMTIVLAGIPVVIAGGVLYMWLAGPY